MELIILPRAAGKTTKLIKKSAALGLRIVCLSQSECARIKYQAESMHLQIQEPVTYSEFISCRTCLGLRVKGYLIDNAEMLLEQMCRMNGAPLVAVTMNTPEYGQLEVSESMKRQITERMPHDNIMTQEQYEEIIHTAESKNDCYIVKTDTGLLVGGSDFIDKNLKGEV